MPFLIHLRISQFLRMFKGSPVSKERGRECVILKVLRNKPVPRQSCLSPLRGAHRALCASCATSRPFRPISPDHRGDCGNYCVPMHTTAQILTQSQNSDNELNQPMFHTESARLLSESAVFARCTYAPPVVGGFQGGYGNAYLLLGAVPALCRSAHHVVLRFISNDDSPSGQPFGPALDRQPRALNRQSPAYNGQFCVNDVPPAGEGWCALSLPVANFRCGRVAGSLEIVWRVVPHGLPHGGVCVCWVRHTSTRVFPSVRQRGATICSSAARFCFQSDCRQTRQTGPGSTPKNPNGQPFCWSGKDPPQPATPQQLGQPMFLNTGRQTSLLALGLTRSSPLGRATQSGGQPEDEHGRDLVPTGSSLSAAVLHRWGACKGGGGAQTPIGPLSPLLYLYT